MDIKSMIAGIAKEQFATLGFYGVSMSAVAKACGKNKATLYHYYDSKESLYNDVFTIYLKELQSNIGKATLPLSEPTQQIKAYIETLIQQDKHILMIINRQLIEGDTHLNPSNLLFMQELQKSFDAIFKTGIGSGDFKMMDPSTVFSMILGACSYYVFKQKFSKSSENRLDQRFADDLFSAIFINIKP